MDSRWLLRALEQQYADMLGPVERDGRTADGEYWSATPQNYLEKIFQIPFWIRKMSPEAFGQLIRRLSAPGRPDDPTADIHHLPPTGESRSQLSSPDRSGSAASVPAPRTASSERTLARQALGLSNQEQEFLASLGGFIGTPRVAKRFVNVYRLLRAYVRDLNSFTGTPDKPGTHQFAAVLLAVVVGFPRQSPSLLKLIDDGSGTLIDVVALAAASTPALNDRASDETLLAAAAALPNHIQKASLEHLRPWTPSVRRFSLHGGPTTMPPPTPTNGSPKTATLEGQPG